MNSLCLYILRSMIKIRSMNIRGDRQGAAVLIPFCLHGWYPETLFLAMKRRVISSGLWHCISNSQKRLPVDSVRGNLDVMKRL